MLTIFVTLFMVVGVVCAMGSFEELLPGIISEVWGCVWTPAIKVSITMSPVVETPVFVMPLLVAADMEDEEWDLASEEPTVLIDVVNPLIDNLAVSVVEREFFNGRDLEFLTEEIIDIVIAKKINSYIPACDYSVDSEDNYIPSSMAQAVNWVDGIKMGVIKDRANRSVSFYSV